MNKIKQLGSLVVLTLSTSAFALTDDNQKEKHSSSFMFGTVQAVMSIPSSYLTYLAESDDRNDRYVAALSLYTPQETLKSLSFDPVYMVRMLARNNPSAHPYPIIRIIGDVRSIDAHALRIRTDRLGVDQSIGHIRSQKRFLPLNFELLAQNSDSTIRGMVARNDDAPQEVLAGLVHDSFVHVRAAVAANPNAGQEIWEKLIEDDDEQVQFYAMQSLLSDNQ